MPVQKFLKTIHQFLYNVPKFWLISSSAVLLVFLSFLDYLTGVHYGFTIFYLFSVLLLTWFVNLPTGILFSSLSIMSWFLIRFVLLAKQSSVGIHMTELLGESSIRLLFLFICCYVLSLLKKDIVIREEQTRELVELNKMKNFFIGMVAHDLRNPLSIIEMSSFNLLEDEQRKNLSQDQVMLLESIYRKSVFMLKMIEEYLDIMKIESGHLQINRGTYDYAKFINDIVALNTIIAKQKNISIEFIKESEMPMFSFDRNKTSQVVSNLLINAINYSRPDSVVKIKISAADKTVLTEIIDNGPGINIEDINRLFESFYRSKSSREKGTGLGLAISKKIVEAHGGTIGVKNNIGNGSTFWFTLPLIVEGRG